MGGKTYVNHLLVESIATPEGPRHRTICSLGSLAPAPDAQWRGLAQKLSSALGGQTTFLPAWATLRAQLSTHQVVTVVLPATNGQTLRIRKGSTPEAIHREIYRTLEIPHEVMTPVKTWAHTPSP